MRLFWFLVLSLAVGFLQSCSHGIFRSRSPAQEAPSPATVPVLAWTKPIPIQGQRDQTATQEIQKIKVGPEGNIYLCGETRGRVGSEANQGEQDVFVMKLSPVGDVLWAKMIGTALSDFCKDMIIDAQGNGVVLGELGTGLKPTDAANPFVALLGPDGKLKWLKQILGSRQTAYPSGIDFESTGSIYLSGFRFRDQVMDGFVHKLDSQGEKIWAVDMTTLTNERPTHLFLYQDVIFAGAMLEGEEPALSMTQWSKNKGDLLQDHTYHTPFAKNARAWMTEAGPQILVPGTEPEGGYTRSVLVSFSAQLEWQWRSLLESAADQHVHLFDVTGDSRGNTYAVAVAYQQAKSSDPVQAPEFFIQSFDLQGRSRYRVVLAKLGLKDSKKLPHNWHYTGRKLAVDRHQNLYILVDDALHKFSPEP